MNLPKLKNSLLSSEGVFGLLLFGLVGASGFGLGIPAELLLKLIEGWMVYTGAANGRKALIEHVLKKGKKDGD